MHTEIMLYKILLLYFAISPTANAVQCLNYNSWNKTTGTCEGDYCAVTMENRLVKYRTNQYCITGLSGKVEMGCTTNYFDYFICLCNTPYCNVVTLPRTTTDTTTLPVVECESLFFEKTRSVASNFCRTKTEKWYGSDEIRFAKEESQDFDSFPLAIPGDSCNTADLQFSFYEGCYNVTNDPEDWIMSCVCSTTKCNTEAPFTPKIGGVTCYTANNRQRKNFNQIAHDLFTGNCSGHFCFLKPDDAIYTDENGTVLFDGIDLMRGCISVQENGNYRLKFGLINIKGVEWYLCKTNNCNFNISTVLEAATKENLTTSSPGGPLGSSGGNTDDSASEQLVMGVILIAITMFI